MPSKKPARPAPDGAAGAGKPKDAKKAAAGRKGGKMRTARNRLAIQASRKKQVLEGAIAGLTQFQIGQKIGLSQQQTSVLYDQALKELNGEKNELGDRERGRQLQVLTRYEERVSTILFDPHVTVLGTDGEGKTFELRDFEMVNKLGDRLVKLLDRRAKLTGADMPTQLEVKAEPLTLADLVARARENGTASGK